MSLSVGAGPPISWARTVSEREPCRSGLRPGRRSTQVNKPICQRQHNKHSTHAERRSLSAPLRHTPQRPRAQISRSSSASRFRRRVLYSSPAGQIRYHAASLRLRLASLHSWWLFWGFFSPGFVMGADLTGAQRKAGGGHWELRGRLGLGFRRDAAPGTTSAVGVQARAGPHRWRRRRRPCAQAPARPRPR